MAATTEPKNFGVRGLESDWADESAPRVYYKWLLFDSNPLR